MTTPAPLAVDQRPVETFGFTIYHRFLAQDAPVWTAMWHRYVREAGYTAVTEPTIEPLRSAEALETNTTAWIVTGRAVDARPETWGPPYDPDPLDDLLLEGTHRA